MILSFLGFYAVMAMMSLIFLAQTAGKNAKASDLWIGAFAWPYTAYRFIKHVLTF